jgi:hypothetical protein
LGEHASDQSQNQDSAFSVRVGPAWNLSHAEAPRLSVLVRSSFQREQRQALLLLQFSLLFVLYDCCESLQGKAGIAFESPDRKTQCFTV